MDRLADSLDPVKDLVPKLGILGVQIDKDISAMVPGLRIASGVIVAARTAFGATVESGLEAGDVIHALNGTTIISLDTLSSGIQQLKAGDPVVLQIERNGGLRSWRLRWSEERMCQVTGVRDWGAAECGLLRGENS